MKIAAILFLFIAAILVLSTQVSAAASWKMNIVSVGNIQPDESFDIWVQGPPGEKAHILFYSNYNSSAPLDTQNLTQIGRYPVRDEFVVSEVGVVYLNWSFADVGSYAILLKNETGGTLVSTFVKIAPDPYSALINYLNDRIAQLEYQLQVVQADMVLWRDGLLLLAVCAIFVAVWRKLPIMKAALLPRDRRLEKVATEWIKEKVAKETIGDTVSEKVGNKLPEIKNGPEDANE